MHILSDHIQFPNPGEATPEGLLAVGGDLSTERLLLAYQNGIFPWYSDGQPILWWSPNPRMVLFPQELKVSKSMSRFIRRTTFEVTYNQDFRGVISNCATVRRIGQYDTWITDDMREAYIALHEAGYAHSVEVWKEGDIVGGLYGIYLKNKGVFCGESMFSTVSNASKYAFISLTRKLVQEDNLTLIDCQLYTDHLASLGAKEIPRNDFLTYLT
ncbi:leucyl/phenylalanyl-tRNA--protein transferase [Gangjinia marincola]|uniref:Leucyl/phenylalanyl-tRNA--protein transferase n=1 Tax=Gangjinia marincola TaxID=578463 RepID=A0ABN1MHW7_9FLAO